MRKRETATNLSSVPLAAIRPVLAPQLAKEQGQDPATVKSLRSLTKSIFGNETSSLAKRPGMKGTGTGAGIDRIAFGKIPEYMGTVYGREQEVDRNKESEQKMLAESFSRPAFATDSSGFKHIAIGFVPPDFGPGFKPEWDCLKRKVSCSERTLTLAAYTSKPYTTLSLRTSLPQDEDHTFLFGPFSKCVPSRELLPLKSNTKRWCRQLYDLLAKDWPNLHFALRIAKDELLVQFPTQKQVLPAMGAIQRYMAHLIAHGDAMKMGLQKRGDRWGVLEAENYSVPAASGTTDLIDSGNRHATPDSTDSPNHHERLDLLLPTTETDEKGSGERYLTFSFYFPWVTIGRLIVHNKEARRERKNTRDIKYARSDESLILDEMVNQTMAEEKEIKWQVRIEKGKRASSVIEPMYSRDALPTA
jgi:hypothetical protein